jgi:hypothetical protein
LNENRSAAAQIRRELHRRDLSGGKIESVADELHRRDAVVPAAYGESQ